MYTTTVTEMLRRAGVEICSIVVLRLFNRKRFFSELKRDGSRLPRKIWRKLFLREKGYKSEKFETIVDFRKRLGIDCGQVGDFTKRFDVPVFSCGSMNDETVMQRLEKDKPDLVVFTGGGLLRPNVLERSGHGVLNCHMGVLPRYRGMDVVEWPILEGEPGAIGVTVHFMDRGVDTGDILTVRKIEPQKGETIAQLRDRFEPIMCQTLVDTAIDFLNGRLERKPQPVEAGRQYFVMHPRLIRLVEQRLQ